jgi:polyhydroxyalkanoate synthesis regulator phasin
MLAVLYFITRRIIMDDLRTELKKKRKRLEDLIEARSKAYCSTINSSEEDVIRETEIEDLEDEIHALQERIKSKK